MITIYHNPKCSKSRETLAITQELAEQHHLDVKIVEYLKTPPTQVQLSELQRLLGCPVADMVRSNEEEYAALNLAQADDAAILAAIAETPKLLQRPIVVHDNRAVIGRPPERVRELF